MKVRVCQCCGHPLPNEDIELALTPMQSKLYKAVKRAGISGITNAQLMDALYAHCLNGGAENSNIIAVMIRKMKPSMISYGLTIRSTGGPGSRYYLNVV